MVDIYRYAGFGVESTFGTPVSASFHIDANSLGLDVPNNPEIIIPSGMGRAPRTKKAGYYVSKGSIEYAFDIETIGWFLRWVLNGYTFTSGGGAPTPNTHEIYGTDAVTLKSFTTREGKDEFEHIFAGCMLNTLDLKIDTGLALATLGIFGGPDTVTALTDYDNLTLTDSVPLGFQEATAFIDEEDESAQAKSFALSINNGIDTNSAQRFGSRYPQTGFLPEGRTITFTTQLVFEDRAHLNLFWGSDTGISIAGSTLSPITLHLADPDATRTLDICIPSAQIQHVPTATRGTDTLIESVIGRAMLADNVTLADESTIDTDILVTLLNDTATMA